MQTRFFLVAILLLALLSGLAQAGQTIVGWGRNQVGQLGAGSGYTNLFEQSPVPMDQTGVLSGKTASAICFGYSHGLLLTTTGELYGWGSNANGEVGDGTTELQPSPVAVSQAGLAGKTISQIACGQGWSMVLTTSGEVWTWGDNTYGTLGVNNTNSSISAQSVLGLSGLSISQIFARDFNGALLDSTGKLYVWGNTQFGHIGDGTGGADPPQALPKLVGGALAGKTITQVTVGYTHMFVLTSDNGLYAWGVSEGVAADGTATTYDVPHLISTASGALNGVTVSKIYSSHSFFVVSSTGALYAWGLNENYQLGNGAMVNLQEPTLINKQGDLTGKTITEICGGLLFTIIRCTDGAVLGLGTNSFGQTGTTTTSTDSVQVPTLVLGGYIASMIACGDESSFLAQTPAGAPAANAPADAPVAVPVAAPVEAPVNAPADVPVAAPASSPTNPPVDAPAAAPVNPPVAAPVDAPMAAPVRPPVAAPVAPPAGICLSGSIRTTSGSSCEQCPAMTYAANQTTCLPCDSGFESKSGASFCQVVITPAVPYKSLNFKVDPADIYDREQFRWSIRTSLSFALNISLKRISVATVVPVKRAVQLEYEARVSGDDGVAAFDAAFSESNKANTLAALALSINASTGIMVEITIPEAPFAAPNGDSSIVGPAVGGAVGGFVGLVILIAIVVIVVRRSKNGSSTGSSKPSKTSVVTVPATVAAPGAGPTFSSTPQAQENASSSSEQDQEEASSEEDEESQESNDSSDNQSSDSESEEESEEQSEEDESSEASEDESSEVESSSE